MVVDNSNKSYAKTIAGIFVIMAVVFIIVALILGISGSKSFSDKYVRSSTTKASYTSEKDDSVKILNNQQGNDDLVPGSKKGCDFATWDTVPGTIAIAIEQDEAYQVPLCINDDNLPSFLEDLNSALNITATVCGGYDPKDYWSDLVLSQFGTVKGNIDIVWVELDKPEDVCCCIAMYEAVFVDKDEDKICFEASVPPTEDDIPECMDLSGVCWPEEVKEISLELEIKWSGCHFWTILVSDVHFPESPTPDL